MAVSVSLQTRIPFLYLRDSRGIKGERRIIEGAYKKNWRIALIDDASGHGQTKKKMIQNIRKEGLVCNHIINLFSADMPLNAYYKRTKIKVHPLINHSELMAYLVNKRKISSQLGKILNQGFTPEKSNWWQNQATKKDWQSYEKLCKESNYPFFKDHLN